MPASNDFDRQFSFLLDGFEGLIEMCRSTLPSSGQDVDRQFWFSWTLFGTAFQSKEFDCQNYSDSTIPTVRDIVHADCSGLELDRILAEPLRLFLCCENELLAMCSIGIESKTVNNWFVLSLLSQDKPSHAARVHVRFFENEQKMIVDSDASAASSS